MWHSPADVDELARKELGWTVLWAFLSAACWLAPPAMPRLALLHVPPVLVAHFLFFSLQYVFTIMHTRSLTNPVYWVAEGVSRHRKPEHTVQLVLVTCLGHMIGNVAFLAMAYPLAGPTALNFGGPLLPPGTGVLTGFFLEASLTFVMVGWALGNFLVPMSQRDIALAGAAIGNGLIVLGGPWTRAILNPASTVATTLLAFVVGPKRDAGPLDYAIVLWVYIVAPLVGAAVVGALIRGTRKAKEAKLEYVRVKAE